MASIASGWRRPYAPGSSDETIWNDKEKRPIFPSIFSRYYSGRSYIGDRVIKKSRRFDVGTDKKLLSRLLVYTYQEKFVPLCGIARKRRVLRSVRFVFVVALRSRNDDANRDGRNNFTSVVFDFISRP